jgi:hypothetical protein
MLKQTMSVLPDFAPCYMVDSKLHWHDFKRSLKENAMAWGFRQWFNTTVYGGPKWKELTAVGLKMKQEDDDEPLPERNNKKKMKTTPMRRSLLCLLQS